MLKETGWLSVRQCVFYHSVLLAWKVVHTRCPVYLNSKLVGNRPLYATRLAAAGSLVHGPRPRLDLIGSSLRWRSAENWDLVPRTICQIVECSKFKQQLKEWVKLNVQV